MHASVTGSIRSKDLLALEDDNGFRPPSQHDSQGFMSLDWDGFELAISFEGPSSAGVHSGEKVAVYTGEDDVIAFTTELSQNRKACPVIVQQVNRKNVSGGVFCARLVGVRVNEDGSFQALTDEPPVVAVAATFQATLQ